MARKKVPADEYEIYLRRLSGVLKALRAETHLTQAQAAERIGVSFESLGNWERGDHSPRGRDLAKLYRFFHRELDAKWHWFLFPPEIRKVDPMAQLAGAASDAAAFERDDWDEGSAGGRASGGGPLGGPRKPRT